MEVASFSQNVFLLLRILIYVMNEPEFGWLEFIFILILNDMWKRPQKHTTYSPVILKNNIIVYFVNFLHTCFEQQQDEKHQSYIKFYLTNRCCNINWIQLNW